jgi:hypothetical protein
MNILPFVRGELQQPLLNREGYLMSRIQTKWALGVTATLLLALGVGLNVGFVQASETTKRPISDFLDRQGDFCLNADFSGGFYQGDRTEPCDPDTTILLVPPVKNFIGWDDPEANLGGSVDYAGLADDVLEGSLGTEFEGEVTERSLPNGRAEVTVHLETENALTFVVEGSDFNVEPLFGERVATDETIHDPVLGKSQLELVFINKKLGDPLPDLVQLFFFPKKGQEVKSIKFEAEAKDEEGKVEITQICRAPCDIGAFDVQIIDLKLTDD